MHAHTTVQTAHASRYLQQLCKHWSHKAAATFTPEAGQVDFATWSVKMSADTAALSVTVTADAQDLPRLQTVVAEHLQRFATKETLSFNWQAAAA